MQDPVPPSIASLVRAPQRVAALAIAVPVREASLAWGIATAFQCIVLALVGTLALRGPFVDVFDYFAEALGPIVFVIAMAVLLVYFFNMLGETARNFKTQIALNVLLLSFVPMTLPVAGFGLCAWGAETVSAWDWSSLRDTSTATWALAYAAGWVLRVLGSGWWLLVFVGAWAILWQWAARRAEHAIPPATPLLCIHCGFELQPTVDADGTHCPECGHAIPRLLSEPG